jgi:hypothetical protein
MLLIGFVMALHGVGIEIDNFVRYFLPWILELPQCFWKVSGPPVGHLVSMVNKVMSV